MSAQPVPAAVPAADAADAADPFAALGAEHIDPALHSLTGDQDRLGTFARILTGTSGPADGAGDAAAAAVVGDAGAVEGDDAFLSGLHDQDGTLFSAAGEPRFGELLDAAGREEEGLNGGNNGGGADGDLDMFENEDRRKDEHDGGEGDDGGDDVRLGRIVGRKRRRTDNEAIVVGPVENDEPLDPIKLKKDSHKEVERRRRENINDGINELAKFVPRVQNDGKMGKGILIRAAAEYMQQLILRTDELEKEVKTLQQNNETARLQEAQQQLQEEHVRALRFEDSWQKAEDRAATAQFEVDRLRGELEQLKK